MEHALQQRIEELSKCRKDYDDLLDRFRQLSAACEEKEKIYQSKIRDLTDTVSDLTSKNNAICHRLQRQKTVLKTFENDARALQEAARLLEMREQDISKTLRSTQDTNSNLLAEVKAMASKNVQLLEERDSLSKILAEEMVSKQDYDLVQQKNIRLNKVIEQDMVPRSQYEQLVEDNKNLKKRMMHEMVDMKDYEELHSKLLATERRLTFDYVSKDDYFRLQQLLQEAHDEKRVIEESVRLIEENRDQNIKLNSENAAKVVYLKGRVEQSEREMSDLRSQHNKMTEDLNYIKEELSRSENARRMAEEKIVMLDTAKSALMTQLSKAKLAVRHEAEAKQAAIEEKAALQKQVDDVKLEFSNKLIESNHKLKDIFDLSEDQIRRTLHIVQDENAGLHDTVESLRNENILLRDKARDLERELVECQGKGKVQDAYLESASRENADLKSEIIYLREEKVRLENRQQGLYHELEEFKATVFAELSPALSKHFVDHAHPLSRSPTPRDTQPPSQPSTAINGHSSSNGHSRGFFKEASVEVPDVRNSPTASLFTPQPPNPPYLDHVVNRYAVLHDTFSHVSNPAERIPTPPTQVATLVHKKSPTHLEVSTPRPVPPQTARRSPSPEKGSSLGSPSLSSARQSASKSSSLAPLSPQKRLETKSDNATPPASPTRSPIVHQSAAVSITTPSKPTFTQEMKSPSSEQKRAQGSAGNIRRGANPKRPDRTPPSPAIVFNSKTSDRPVVSVIPEERGRSPVARRLVADHCHDSPSLTLPRANSTPQRHRLTDGSPARSGEISTVVSDRTPVHKVLVNKNDTNHLLLITPDKKK
eukprot:gene37106-45041_t